MRISIENTAKVEYANLTDSFASITFDNGLSISLSREQAESIVERFNQSKEVEEFIEELKSMKNLLDSSENKK